MFSTRLFQAKGQGQGRKKTLSYPLQMEVCLTRQSGLKNKAQNSGKLHLREFSKFLALNTASHVLLVVRAVKKKNTLLFVALNSIFDTVFLRSTRFPKRSQSFQSRAACSWWLKIRSYSHLELQQLQLEQRSRGACWRDTMTPPEGVPLKSEADHLPLSSKKGDF